MAQQSEEQEQGRRFGKYKQKIRLSKLFEEIKNCKDTIYRLSDAIIEADSVSFNRQGGFHFYGDTMEIKVELRIRNCKWERKEIPVISNKKFLKPISIIETEGMGIVFTNCEFHQFFRWGFSTIPVLNFYQCKFLGSIDFFNNHQSSSFNACEFDFRNPSSIFQYRHKNTFFSLESWNEGKVESLYFGSCRFSSQREKFMRLKMKANSLVINDSDFGNIVLDMEGSQIAHSTEITQCKFNTPLGLEGVLFSAPSTFIPWNEILGYKIALYDDYEKDAFQLKPIKQATDSSIFEATNYFNYKAIYANLLNIYKIRGDQVSYNTCYVEMKDIETRKYEYDFEKQISLKNFFVWKLNVFLRTFCDYGTDPVKSVLYAFYVIICFSIIYFIFPSEKDNLRREFILQKVDKYITYFTTDKKLTEMHAEEQKHRLDELDILKEKLQGSRSHVPIVLQVIGYPFYIASFWYYQLTYWFVKKGEISAGIWAKQSKKKRAQSAFLISLYFISYIISGLFMRCLNAIMLSINVFVTLGYGEIPARGIAKYLAVVEGLIGWFLLSIFSVSLISQVLN